MGASISVVSLYCPIKGAIVKRVRVVIMTEFTQVLLILSPEAVAEILFLAFVELALDTPESRSLESCPFYMGILHNLREVLATI